MAGRNSVAIAIDARFGLGMQTISTGDDRHRHVDRDDDAANANDDECPHRVTESGGGGGGDGNPRILHLPNSNALLAWTGLYGDGLGFAEEMSVSLARRMRVAGCMGFPDARGGATGGRRKMSPRAIAMFMSHLLYRRRNAPYYVEPVIVGLETARVPISAGRDRDGDDTGIGRHSREIRSAIRDGVAGDMGHRRRECGTRAIASSTAYETVLRPYLCGTDMLGAQSASRSFVCAGVASRSLHGTAEAMWRPNLEGEELVEVCGKAFISALERDILSGYGAVVYLIRGGKDEDDVEIIEYVLACRND
jgi:20S proteasome alpha/beta subunit